MRATTYQRFESDEQCPESGRYEFDGFVDAGPAGMPHVDELFITVAAGELFPKAGNPPRSCFWKLVDGVRGVAPVQDPAAPVEI